jgi:hypothetical protein
VKLGVSDANAGNSDGILSHQMAEICRHGSCYFWFSKGHSCMLVLWCEKGKCLSLADAGRLTIVDVCADCVTLAITERAARPLLIHDRQSGKKDFAAWHSGPALDQMSLSEDSWVAQTEAQELPQVLCANL